MQDYVAYVNQTGLNPFTGKKASDDVTFMAKHYHTVQAVNTFGLTLTGGYMDYVGLKSGVSAAAVSDDVGEVRGYQVNNQNFPERIKLPNGKKGYLSADIVDGKQVPVRSPEFLDESGRIRWPEADGFVVDGAGKAITEPANLKSGQVIDRYGNSSGRFTSPLENGQKLPYETRGLPYPEGYQPYHKYEVVVDLTEENIMKAYNGAPQIIQEKIQSSLNYYGLDIDELINIRRGEIAKVFGQGGGTQIQFGSSINYYEDLGLIREVQ